MTQTRRQFWRRVFDVFRRPRSHHQRVLDAYYDELDAIVARGRATQQRKDRP